MSFQWETWIDINIGSMKSTISIMNSQSKLDAIKENKTLKKQKVNVL